MKHTPENLRREERQSAAQFEEVARNAENAAVPDRGLAGVYRNCVNMALDQYAVVA